MKKFNAWTHDYSEVVGNLQYEYPFAVGDFVVAHFESGTDEINNLSSRYVMKVIQVGVPVEQSNQSTKIDEFGNVEFVGSSASKIVEGVRTQLLFHKDDIYEDLGHGYKENLPVSMLKQVDRPSNVITNSFNSKIPNRDLNQLVDNKYERRRKAYKKTNKTK